VAKSLFYVYRFRCRTHRSQEEAVLYVVAMDRAVWLNVGARLDWRSVQSLSCARPDLASLSQDADVQTSAQARSIEENWRDGRSRERPLPSELLRAQYLQTARLGGGALLSALWYDDTDEVGEDGGLYDCRTMTRVARFANPEQPGGDPPTTGLDMTSDGRHALILRRSADFEAEVYMPGGLAAYLYDPCKENHSDTSELQPLLRIMVDDRNERYLGAARPTGALDRIVVDQFGNPSNSLVSYDVATGGQRTGAILHQHWLTSLCEHGDGRWLAIGKPKCGGPNDHLLQFDPRSPGLDRSVHSLTRCPFVAGVGAVQHQVSLRKQMCSCGAPDVVSRGHVVAVLEGGCVQAWDVRTWRHLYKWSPDRGSLRYDERDPLRLDARGFVAISARTERKNRPRTHLQRTSLEDGRALGSLALGLDKPLRWIVDMSVCDSNVFLREESGIQGGYSWRMFDLLN
ncbi:Hypothetical protein UVM_LOCUS105, partial [uncultured virus]